jgi:hypothetical protein
MTLKNLIPHDHDQPVNNPVQMMILALFFQLLVFFILMNSISSMKSDADEVTLSLRRALGDESSITIQGTGVFSGLRSGVGSGTSLSDYEGYFEHDMPGVSHTYSKRTGELALILPANTLNRILGLSGQRVISERLRSMIAFIRESREPSYRVVLTRNIRPGLLESQNIKDFAPNAFLVAWADALVQLGIPADKLEYGVASGPAGTVTLHIVALAPVKQSSVEIMP